jgi:hypothetical protein
LTLRFLFTGERRSEQALHAASSLQEVNANGKIGHQERNVLQEAKVPHQANGHSKRPFSRNTPEPITPARPVIGEASDRRSSATKLVPARSRWSGQSRQRHAPNNGRHGRLSTWWTHAKYH